MPFTDCLQRIRSAGGEHILLLTSPNGPIVRRGDSPGSQFPNLTESDPNAIAELVEAAGLRVSSVLGSPRTDVSSDEATRTTLDRFLVQRERAEVLGAAAFCVSAPTRSDDGSSGENIRRLARLMSTLAAGSQLTVSVDIHMNSLIQTVADCRALVEAMDEPGAGLLLNVGHLTTAQQDGWNLITNYPERIKVIGWKDHSLAEGRPEVVYSVELGTGATPFERYVSTLGEPQRSTVVHLVNVEHPPAGEEVETLRRSIRYWRGLWAHTAEPERGSA
jgi:sugar phosphate isomerase/epimerase